MKVSKKYRLKTLGNRGIPVLLFGVLSGLLTLPLIGQETDIDDTNTAHGDSYNIFIGPIGGKAHVSTQEHPTYTTYGISVSNRVGRYVGFAANFERYRLIPSDKELKDTKDYPIRDHSAISFGI